MRVMDVKAAQSHRWSLMALTVILMATTGCSVYMAAKQPSQKDLSVLNLGTHRSAVIAELGAPVWSGEKDGNKTDLFVFRQGYHTANKTARALFHGTADVFSLGLWEVFATPGEAYFSGRDMKVEVAYDNNELVKSAKQPGGSNSVSGTQKAVSETKTGTVEETQSSN